jgi:curved DNA-binding protein CbpA
MTSSKDFYSILGVLPDAEDVVIVAAYRALSSRYHPDRWTGDPTTAHERMTGLNEAYAVLNDVQKRKAYDQERTEKGGTFTDDENGRDDAFDTALGALENRWQIAVGIFPDLSQIRKQLAQTGHRLAFAFVVTMLESRRFNDRKAIAESMEKSFLERYFGTDKTIVELAKELIQMSMKGAILRLNQLVDVMGSEVAPELLIQKIDQEFGLVEARSAQATKHLNEKEAQEMTERIRRLRNSIKERRYSDEAFELAHILGYEIDKLEGGWLRGDKYAIRRGGGSAVIFQAENLEQVVVWVNENLCID